MIALHSCGLILMTAFASLGCSSRQDATLYPASSERAARVANSARISTAEQEADSYWSSTYGNPRPKLTETVSLGTSDLPTSAPPAPTASLASDTAIPASSSFAQASATAIVVVPSAARWSPERGRPRPARGLDSSGSAKHSYSGAPPKTPAPAPPKDFADTSTRRTSIVAPKTVHVALE